MTTQGFDPMEFHAEFKGHIDRIKEKLGIGVDTILGDHRHLYPQLDSSICRVSREAFECVLCNYEGHFTERDLRELPRRFTVYEAEIAKMPSARSSIFMPAESMKLIEARRTLKRYGIENPANLSLGTEEGLERFIQQFVLVPAYQQDYKAAINAGQAAIELALRSHSAIGLPADGPQAVAVAQMTLALAWIGKQVNERWLVLWARDETAKIKEYDPFSKSVHLHIQGYLKPHGQGSVLAEGALQALRSGQSCIRISSNYQRSLEARLLGEKYVRSGRPLTARVPELGSSLTVAKALDRNIELAEASDRNGSLPIAHVQKGEALLLHGEVGQAVEAYLDAREANDSNPIAGNTNMIERFFDDIQRQRRRSVSPNRPIQIDKKRK